MKTLSVQELKTLVERHGDIALIDVVPDTEPAWRKWPGMARIPLQDETFLERVEHLVGRSDRRIVVYGNDPNAHATRQAAQLLQNAGYSNVYACQPPTG